MGVEDHHLFDPGGGHALTNVGPQADQGLGLEREGAGKARVFGAEANRLGWQEQGGRVGRQVGQGGGHDAVGNAAVNL